MENAFGGYIGKFPEIKNTDPSTAIKNIAGYCPRAINMIEKLTYIYYIHLTSPMTIRVILRLNPFFWFSQPQNILVVPLRIANIPPTTVIKRSL